MKRKEDGYVEEEIKMSQIPHITSTIDIICRRELLDDENNGIIELELDKNAEEKNDSSRKNERLSLEDLI